MKKSILILILAITTLFAFSQKTVTNLSTIVKNDSVLSVTFSYLYNSKTIDTTVSVAIGVIDISKMQLLMAEKLYVNSDSISNFVYQAENEAIELNRRFLVNIRNSPILEPIILNINPQYKTINGRKVLINVSAFTLAEIETKIDYTGLQIITYCQTLINKK